ncbi:MAG TPA: hypothetical protein VHC63_17365 [Acidimicrobiales bacterium]|nr:hypothetical protein [Acidimicrobiales bacterium]
MSALNRTRWIQVLLGINLVTLLPLALWPLVSPRGFYDKFPGGPYHWIDINGPYNEHFLRDFGALNAALVVILVFALWKPTTSLLQATGLALAVYALPHAIYHLSHLDVYKSSEKFIATAPLVLQFAMGLVVVGLSSARPAPSPAPAT